MQFLLLFLIALVAFVLIYAVNNRGYQGAISNWLKANGCVAVNGVRRMNPLNDKHAAFEVKNAEGRRFLVELKAGGPWRGSYYRTAKLVSQREIAPKSR